MHADDNIKRNPIGAITRLIGESSLQVSRITEAVLAESNLANEVAALMHSSTCLRHKLAGLTTDERDCLRLLADVRANRLSHLSEFQSLSDEAMAKLRRRLAIRLTTHLAAVRRNQSTLERGIELARAGMLNRFATFALAGLSQDWASSMNTARAFVVVYLVAARLKDRLQTAGFRWAGEKILVSLYLNAVSCERGKCRERLVADPISSMIATAIGFVSAQQLHRAFYQLHRVLIGEEATEDLAFIDFPQPPPGAFERSYYRVRTPEEEYHRLLHRTRYALVCLPQPTDTSPL